MTSCVSVLRVVGGPQLRPIAALALKATAAPSVARNAPVSAIGTLWSSAHCSSCNPLERRASAIATAITTTRPKRVAMPLRKALRSRARFISSAALAQ